MSKSKLNELYRLVSGNTLVDFDTIINNLKDIHVEDRLNYIGKYLYSVPGGIGNKYLCSQFRLELYKVLGENSIFLTPDIDKNSNINQDDYYRVVLEQIDVNGDNKFTIDDLEIVKILSTSTISEELGDGKENGYDYVDLGLPSGTMWATCNVGADKVTDPGLLFQFGRVDGYKYEDENHKFRTPTQNEQDTGNSYIPLTTSGATYKAGEILKLEDDAAHVNMGGKWKMPTRAQYQEMLNNTTHKVIKDLKNQQRIIGTLFTSNINGKRLFIPFAGYWYNGSFDALGSRAYMWSSQVHSSNVDIAYNLICYSGDDVSDDNSRRSLAFSVRGVFQFNPSIPLPEPEEPTPTPTTPPPTTPPPTTPPPTTPPPTTPPPTTPPPTTPPPTTPPPTTPPPTTPPPTTPPPIDVNELTQGDGEENGYRYVDLGLPYGLKWATCNVGGTKPEDPGLLFQFGRVDGYKYGDKNHKFRTNEQNMEDSGNSYIPLTTSGATYDKGEILEPADDAAHVNMGGNWRMPTNSELNTLLNNTDQSTVTVNGVKGRLFTSRINGHQLFIPFTGSWYGESFKSDPYVWSSRVDTYYATHAYKLIVDGYSVDSNHGRNSAFSVRGVF